MGQRLLSQCNKSLNFFPETDLHPLLPAVSWQGHVIAGFSSTQENTTALDDQPFSEAMRACYRELSLAETGRFYALVKNQSLFTLLDWERLIEKFGWKWNDQLKKTFESLAQTPLAFQNWSTQRKFGIKDWSLLNALPEIAQVMPLLQQIAESLLSYQNGRQVMESGIELFMSGRDLESLLKKSNETEIDWQQRLYALRYPLSTNKEIRAKDKLKSLPCPPHIKLDWRRNGDLTGLQVEFFAHSPTELRRKLERLTGFERLLDGEASLWTN